MSDFSCWGAMRVLVLSWNKGPIEEEKRAFFCSLLLVYFVRRQNVESGRRDSRPRLENNA